MKWTIEMPEMSDAQLIACISAWGCPKPLLDEIRKRFANGRNAIEAMEFLESVNEDTTYSLAFIELFQDEILKWQRGKV
jgi:hypothetical protein